MSLLSLPSTSLMVVFQKVIWLLALDAMPVFLRPRYNAVPTSSTWWLRYVAMTIFGWWWWYCYSVSFVAFIIPLLSRRFISHAIATTWPSLLLPGSNALASSEQRRPQQHKTNKTDTRNSWTEWLSLLSHGPLGYGAAKLVVAVVGMTIYSLVVPLIHANEEDPHPPATLSSLLLQYCRVGPLWPTHAPWLPILVGGVAAAVNAVLWAWSTLQQTKGNHSGVDHMVAGSTHRPLTIVEHLRYLTWAAVNAACEEVIYRGLLRGDVYAILHTQLPNNNDKNHTLLLTNLVQAASFGLAHYYGIPSGWTGVALTLVYGGLMGVLADIGHGLFWPIVAHTLADYYIFVTIARRKLE